MACSPKQTRRRFLLGIALYLAFGSLAGAEENPWQALRSGTAVGLLRHATAPGIGDPAHFRLDDCATQRNLSEAGRQQARAIGAAGYPLKAGQFKSFTPRMIKPKER